MIEQLFGGKHDGREVETVSNPATFTLPSGERFIRRTDGRLYGEDCGWDDGPRWSDGRKRR